MGAADGEDPLAGFGAPDEAGGGETVAAGPNGDGLALALVLVEAVVAVEL